MNDRARTPPELRALSVGSAAGYCDGGGADAMEVGAAVAVGAAAWR